jgi:DNA-binding winged helix-turn-helix (wHTH) protein
MGGNHREVFGESRGFHQAKAMQVRFGEFVLDRGTRQLLRNGQEHHIGPKAFELLELLLSQRPNVVPKERIRDRLWPDTFVSGSTLATVVGELRSALDEDPKQPQFLRTVHAVGYAFCGEATESGRPPRTVDPGVTAAFRLVLEDH